MSSESFAEINDACEFNGSSPEPVITRTASPTLDPVPERVAFENVKKAPEIKMDVPDENVNRIINKCYEMSDRMENMQNDFNKQLAAMQHQLDELTSKTELQIELTRDLMEEQEGYDDQESSAANEFEDEPFDLDDFGASENFRNARFPSWKKAFSGPRMTESEWRSTMMDELFCYENEFFALNDPFFYGVDDYSRNNKIAMKFKLGFVQHLRSLGNVTFREVLKLVPLKIEETSFKATRQLWNLRQTGDLKSYFVKFQELSPKVASCMKNKEFLKHMFRLGLKSPLNKMSEFGEFKTYQDVYAWAKKMQK